MSKKIHPWNMKLLLLVVAFFQVLFLPVAGQDLGANDLVLVSDGQARMTIAYAEGPTDKELAAAKRLQHFLARITGVSLPIAPLSQAPADRGRVLLGPRAAQTVGIDIAQTYPGGERVIVKKVGNDLVIAGNDAQIYQGTRYAVDRFLEKLGCECFGPNPNWHVIPKMDKVVFDDINIDISPAFECRSTFFFKAPHSGSHPDFDGPSWGLGGTPYHITHNYYQMYPAARFFDDHPEWYSLVDGQRKSSQICFSNSEVQARAIKLARAHFDNDPSQVMFSLTANDGHGFCECEPCSQMGANPSEQSLSFANIVARGLRTTHPDKNVAFLAYYGTHTAPVDVQAEPGVEVWVVNHICTAHSLDNASCAKKTDWKQLFQGWKASGADVSGIYEYYLPSYGGWKNVPLVLGDASLRDLRYYRDNGIRYLYYQSDHLEVMEDGPIRWPLYYVVAKGMWNPDLTAEQILRPACERLFGNASEPMLSFYLECARAVEAAPFHGVWWGMPKAKLVYTPQVVKTIRRLLGKAKQMATAESPEVIRRVNEVIECWGRTEQILDPDGKP